MNELIDLIYEAAVVPELWPRTLDRLAALSGSAGAVLFTSDYRQVTGWTASETVVPVIESFIAGGWSTRNPRFSALSHAVGLSGWGTDEMIFAPGQRETDPMYQQLLAPLGFGWFAGTYVRIPSGDVAVFDIERRTESGPMPGHEVEQLNGLRPHLARAAILSTRLGLERARAAVEVLALIGLPAAVLAAGGRLLAANALLEESERHVAVRAFDRVALVRPAAQRLFADALARLERGLDLSTASIALPGAPDLVAAVAHVVPVRRAAHDVFAGASALLVLTPLAQAGPSSAELLGGLFDLTPAEARVAGALAGGQTVDDAARALGVTRETVRTHLKGVFAKTGVERQAELVRLLAGTSFAFRGPAPTI